MAAWPNILEKWSTGLPKAGKRSYTACSLYISGRYNVYVACRFPYKFRSHHTGSMGAGMNGPKGGGAPCNLPISNGTGTGKERDCTQKRGFKGEGSIAPVPPCCPWMMALRTLNTRTLIMNLMYNLACMFLLMYSLFYDFLGIFLYLFSLSLLLARWVVFTGTPVNFDSLLPARGLTQKSRNKLSKVPNININML